MNQSDNLIELASAASAAVDLISPPYLLNGIREFSLHVKFSDSGAGGTLWLQGSNDPTAYKSPGTADWVNILDSDQTVAGGASHVWNVQGANYQTMRFTWTNAAGAGTLTAWLVVKFIEG